MDELTPKEKKKIKDEKRETIRRRTRVADDAKIMYINIESNNYKSRPFSEVLLKACIEVSEGLNKSCGKYIGTGKL